MLRQPVAQPVDALLNQQRLQARDGGAGEEAVPGFAPQAVPVVVQGVEDGLVVRAEHPHGPGPFVALPFGGTDVQLVVEVGVVDVDLVGVYSHDGT